jgi:hypothetical protein
MIWQDMQTMPPIDMMEIEWCEDEEDWKEI